MKTWLLVSVAVLGMVGCSKKEKKQPEAGGSTAPPAGGAAEPVAVPAPVPVPVPKPAAAPKFPPGTGKGSATIGKGGKREGMLPMDDLVKPLTENLPAFEGCYEKGLAEKPGLKGNVQLAFVINDKGKVIKSFAQGLRHEGVETCMAAVVSSLEFRWPADGKPVAGFIPILVAPTGK